MTPRRAGTRKHPCAPWLDAPPELARRLLPGGLGASEETLRARARHLESWKPPVGFDAVVERVRTGQGDDAAATLARIGSGEPVVFTGQQPSFGGGPMFVWLKAWSAVAHARRAEQLLGRPVHALFWIAGDDADLLEVRSLSDPLRRAVFDAHEPGSSGPLLPAGPIPYPPHRAAAAADAIASVWTDSALPGLLRGTGDLSGTMLACLRRWFGDRLVVVDAAWPETRRCASKVYRAFAEQASAVHADVATGIERAGAAGLPVSIRTWPDRLRLFRVSERGRARVVAEGDAWTDGVERWTDNELLAAIDQDASRFSHDVVSRPFAAEAAFPTLAHVLGPGEFAYFAALGPLSSRMGSLAPVLPRASATFLPSGPWPLAREAGWDPVAAPAPAFGALSDALLESRAEGAGLWSKLWADARADYLGMLGDGATDRAPLDALSLRLEAFEARWRRARVRATAPGHARDLDALRRLAVLAGQGGLQERLWSPWGLEHHFGDPSLLRRIEEVLDPAETAHVVWEVP